VGENRRQQFSLHHAFLSSTLALHLHSNSHRRPRRCIARRLHEHALEAAGFQSASSLRCRLATRTKMAPQTASRFPWSPQLPDRHLHQMPGCCPHWFPDTSKGLAACTTTTLLSLSTIPWQRARMALLVPGPGSTSARPYSDVVMIRGFNILMSFGARCA
jgi:hypothetical protein